MKILETGAKPEGLLMKFRENSDVACSKEDLSTSPASLITNGGAPNLER